MEPSRQPHRLLLIIAYVGFISLGLPDTLIGVAWPSVREGFHLAQKDLGLIFLGSGCGYFLSSIFTGKLLRWLGIGLLLAASSALVATSSFGYSAAPWWALFATCAVFHGLGSGAIDAGLNHYVASHFPARHMNWLHACYSLGATLGPLIMTAALAHGAWRAGYAAVGSALLVLALLFIATRRLWGSSDDAAQGDERKEEGVTAVVALRNRLVWLQVVLFFIYTGLEVTVGQWSFTLLTESRLIDHKTAGLWVTVYWGSIGVGRVLFGFVVERVGIDRLLRGSTVAIGAGIALIASRWSGPTTLVGLLLTGLGLAPVYPCLMTRTPERLGKAVAAHAIGFQVGAAMLGAAALPSATGFLAQRFGLETIIAACAVMAAAWGAGHELLIRTNPRVVPSA